MLLYCSAKLTLFSHSGNGSISPIAHYRDKPDAPIHRTLYTSGLNQLGRVYDHLIYTN
ncbi:hypothetical protein IX315_001538 [Porphyromonas levii]|nr:hypothetical protein [Porphyromonas levii]MBR8763667.1 hypothetical protein [Porphyromonas levii]MBR8774190.1 hypothetical protein [Porphyromonas levii]MBR8807133.1 hypothetical protein [Porphyromonas levii]